MAPPSPVKDRGAYIDKAVDEAAKTPPPPTPPPPPPKRQKSKVEQDMDDAIYGPAPKSQTGEHSADTLARMRSSQSTDADNSYQ